MIDERALIHPSAKIGSDVTVGPWTFIGENAVIGDDTQIDAHVMIGKNTVIGKNNKIYPYASIGSDPQHIRYKGQETRLEIGNSNVIREFVTINRGTYEGHGVTSIGHNNYLMAYSHVAHDCRVRSHVIFANTASIAGHVEVGDHANLGAFSGVHQFCRIGAYCFLGRAAKVYQDILPYMLVTGNPGIPTALNSVGLRRHGFNSKTMQSLKLAYRLIYRTNLKLEDIRIELEKLAVETPEINQLLLMINSSTRGFARYKNNEQLSTHDNLA
ncbi:acyl-ACP--UDP-N-acetylglucosamine O-acyltransferase [Candidatus Coxiella mudrowiae]|uniref:Acyl-[acyl-carrier-protein]--UDP-N-acetylglucosamine O-acyltransferase n=1 Tax=Candidatus Coxiella mudrowiae TaxID=2054173 RepID=A0ABM5UU14_9COXI|nr:acyl-ACP--UDP-N-acetylglucosamine O-acyltransferase [Candidatus Coxiella mudrowiae]AKQ33375.1 Acyl-[acyl-carrier-protein]--UDP-N-acetylglucosamine O-acyltransferase [Candidatus Coxiella mudrowiae]AKQ33462.1 Acyl-[acyl-carrier-protein]--UDP-N-acetylglucosamine O-acyltransferase [Candidatus Coxiella mudrowiae]